MAIGRKVTTSVELSADAALITRSKRRSAASRAVIEDRSGGLPAGPAADPAAGATATGGGAAAPPRLYTGYAITKTSPSNRAPAIHHASWFPEAFAGKSVTVGEAPIAAPHWLQNRAPPGGLCPHLGHSGFPNAAPQFAQNRPPSAAEPQLGHFIRRPPYQGGAARTDRGSGR